MEIEIKYATIARRRTDLLLPGGVPPRDVAVVQVQVRGALTKRLLATITQLLSHGWKDIALEFCDDTARDGLARLLISQIEEEVKRQNGTLRIKARTDGHAPRARARQSNGGFSGGSPAEAIVVPRNARRKRRQEQ